LSWTEHTSCVRTFDAKMHVSWDKCLPDTSVTSPHMSVVPTCITTVKFYFAFMLSTVHVCLLHSIFRSSSSDDLVDWNSGVSVRPCVHKKSDFHLIWCVGRPRPHMRTIVTSTRSKVKVKIKVTELPNLRKVHFFMVALWNRETIYIFILFFSSSSSFFSSPNLSSQRLDVYHTSANGVALVRI